MNILVYPMYSKQELNADSNYVVYSSLIRQMLLTRPNWQWTVIFPDLQSGFKYEDDGFFKLPNVSRIPMRISPRKMANAISFDGTYMDAVFRQIGFDIVWCNLVEVADKLVMGGTSTYEKVGRPVIVAAHNYMIHPVLPYPFEVLAPVAFQQLAGGLFADWNVFDSQNCQQMFLDVAKMYLNEDAIKKVMDKTSLINYGTLDPDWKPIKSRNKIPVIAYNHRLQGYKNWRETFELLNELYQEGVPFRVKYLNNTSENTSHLLRYPFVEVDLSATHAAYIEKLKGCDLNVTNSSHETFCISMAESMAFGQPIIAPNTQTFPEITGKASNSYPFLYSNRKEQKEYLRQLLTKPDLRQKWGAVVSKHVLSNYTRPIWAERYAKLFEELAASVSLGSPPDVLDYIKANLETCGHVTIRDFFNIIRDKQVNGRIPISNQSFPMAKIMRAVRHVGGVVKMVDGQQMVWMDGGKNGSTKASANKSRSTSKAK